MTCIYVVKGMGIIPHVPKRLPRRLKKKIKKQWHPIKTKISFKEKGFLIEGIGRYKTK